MLRGISTEAKKHSALVAIKRTIGTSASLQLVAEELNLILQNIWILRTELSVWFGHACKDTTALESTDVAIQMETGLLDQLNGFFRGELQEIDKDTNRSYATTNLLGDFISYISQPRQNPVAFQTEGTK